MRKLIVQRLVLIFGKCENKKAFFFFFFFDRERGKGGGGRVEIENFCRKRRKEGVDLLGNAAAAKYAKKKKKCRPKEHA